MNIDKLSDAIGMIDDNMIKEAKETKKQTIAFPFRKLAVAAAIALVCFGSVPVLAAADEWAVENFIKGAIGYTDIAGTVEECLAKAPEIACDSLDAVWEANDWTWKHLSR